MNAWDRLLFVIRGPVEQPPAAPPPAAPLSAVALRPAPPLRAQLERAMKIKPTHPQRARYRNAPISRRAHKKKHVKAARGLTFRRFKDRPDLYGWTGSYRDAQGFVHVHYFSANKYGYLDSYKRAWRFRRKGLQRAGVDPGVIPAIPPPPDFVHSEAPPAPQPVPVAVAVIAPKRSNGQLGLPLPLPEGVKAREFVAGIATRYRAQSAEYESQGLLEAAVVAKEAATDFDRIGDALHRSH